MCASWSKIRVPNSAPGAQPPRGSASAPGSLAPLARALAACPPWPACCCWPSIHSLRPPSTRFHPPARAWKRITFHDQSARISPWSGRTDTAPARPVESPDAKTPDTGDSEVESGMSRALDTPSHAAIFKFSSGGNCFQRNGAARPGGGPQAEARLIGARTTTRKPSNEPADPELSAKLHRMFKWNNYFEITNKTAAKKIKKKEPGKRMGFDRNPA